MRRFSWTLALVLALTLFGGRLLALYVADVVVRGEPGGIALMRLETRVEALRLAALAAGLGAAAAFRWLPRWPATLLTAAATFVVLAGWGWDSVHPATEPGSRGELLARLAFGTGAVAVGLASAWAARRRTTAAAKRRFGVGRLAAVLLPVAALVLTPPLLERRARDAGLVPRLVTVSDLLMAPERLEVLTAPPRLEPGIDDILTHGNWLGGAAEPGPALVLHPLTRIRARAPADLGTLRLVASAAPDLRSHAKLGRRDVSGALELRASIDGVTVLEREFPLGTPLVDLRPVLLFGAEGAALAPGSTFEFELAWRGEPGEEPRARPRLGFVELRLARVEPRRRGRATPEAPNLVLVVHDTLRADRTSTYGYAKPTTPNLDALAARGLVYDAATAPCSWTWPSTASILTGLGAEAHGVTGVAGSQLADSLVTLPEVLGPCGYLCAAFVGNPLVARQHGFAQGFDLFVGAGAWFRFSEEILPDVVAWLETHSDERFFLYLHLVDSHGPYDNRTEFVERFAEGRLPPEHGFLGAVGRRVRDARARGIDASDVVTAEERELLSLTYDASVATGDHYLGLVLDTLGRLELDDRTVVVVTADHGEELLEHGMLEHGEQLHAEQIRAPLVLAGPSLPRGERRSTPVSNRHVAPTLARLGGAALEELVAPLDLARPTPPPAQPVYFSTHRGNLPGGRDLRHLVGLRVGDHVVHVHATDGSEVLGLYDLATDPDELRDLGGERPGLAQTLSARALELAREQQARAPRGRAGGEATLEQLRALGYLGDDPVEGEGEDREGDGER